MNARDLSNQNQKSIFQKFLDNYRLHIGILGIFWMCIDRGINLSKDYRIASYKDIHQKIGIPWHIDILYIFLDLDTQGEQMHKEHQNNTRLKNQNKLHNLLENLLFVLT